MRVRLATSFALLAVTVPAVCLGAGAAGRPPIPGPDGVDLQGYFYRPAWGGNVTFRIVDGPTIRQVDGILPGPCYDKRKRRVVRPGRDGAIGLQFSVYPNAPVHANGSFSFTAKGVGDITPHTVTVRGTFYGNNALGRVKGRGGKSQYDPLSNCKGDEPFWARRLDPEPA
jgi:hypothetical protein